MDFLTTPPQGLLHAYYLDGQGGIEAAEWTDANRGSSDRPLWLHFDFSQPEAAEWISFHSGLNEVAVEGLLSDDTRPHFLTRGDNLLLVMRGVNLNQGSQPEDMVSIRVWTDGIRIISSRRRRLMSTQDLLETLRQGRGPKNVSELLIDWIDYIVARMSTTVDSIEDELLECEEGLITKPATSMRIALMKIRQRSIALRRYLSPQREALNRLDSVSLSWLSDLNRLSLRSIEDRQIRHVEDLDTVRERAAMAQEELAARTAEQLNERSYILTLVAALFLPLGFFTGLMGINVGGMPGVDHDTAFWIVVGICIVITVALGVLFRWKRWL